MSAAKAILHVFISLMFLGGWEVWVNPPGKASDTFGRIIAIGGTNLYMRCCAFFVQSIAKFAFADLVVI
jgi:hypothetical protein